MTRSAAEEKVKGLAPFRKQNWKMSLKSDDNSPTNVGDLARNVFGGEGLNKRCLIQVDASPALDKWWHDFKGTSQLVRRSKQQTASLTKRSPSPSTKSINMEDDDDFQVQPTPPHLQSKNKSPPITIADDASTEDEEEMAVKLPPEPGAKNAASSEDSKTNGLPATTAPVPADEDETASEASDDEMTTSHGPSSSLPAPAPSKPTIKAGGLGRIGGAAAKVRAIETEKAPEIKENTENQAIPKPQGPKKLGVIGKKADTGSSKTSMGDNTAKRGRPAEREESQTDDQPRETSQERADRRREELKNELQRKAAAGPAKKKRRF